MENDVYVASYEENNVGSQVPKFWKNGVPIILSASPGAANRIVVNGIDVYVKGTVNENGKNKSKIWKNGLELFATENEIRGIAVNKDVYAVGNENSKSKIWQNGIGTNLTNSGFNSDANDIEVKGNDVYVVGEETIGNVVVVKLWKNRIGSNLSDGIFYNTATAISISGNDVYVLGSENDNKVVTSKVWKNGEVIWSKEKFLTTDIKAIGQDYYILSNLGFIAKIVKNGVPQDLSSALNSYANALFITTN